MGSRLFASRKPRFPWGPGQKAMMMCDGCELFESLLKILMLNLGSNILKNGVKFTDVCFLKRKTIVTNLIYLKVSNFI